MTLTIPLLAGTLASMLHVISGPDHLAAVTPLVIETKRKAWKIGLFWGLGHLVGMLLIGVLFLLFKEYIPVESISKYSEQLVAIVLIGVGFWAFYRIFNEQKKHQHPHVHNEGENYVHIHAHEHSHNEGHKHVHDKIVKQNVLSSFGIGFLHGLAGVAHFLLLLPVLGFENNLEGLQYIIGFAIGTVLAMSVYALILGKLTSHSKHQHNDNFFKGIRFAGGLFAIVIGFYWLYLTF
ncbi:MULTISPECIES: urease accessory protein UreH domain-containing protein [Flavobacteriaceae]|jgi:ABC-type nickel/cobalt efflux system permease component RcnA|uniref:urease accessory protein UreH domain-containing protein n=1 Tax=Flavobacteriaceae TaxID=49546 RepID=UPI000550F691|nr:MULTISPECIES: sulfite exporter TauE/SafE family protein [Flavobacteriaceae]TVZ27057.1 cytochrome C biogenesis DsbD-like protein [Gillisia sp. Hel_I_86]|tara:strand:+ start:412 stop:1119 length:708 start_codon:yes stop_codon:yes gene_type:complete